MNRIVRDNYPVSELPEDLRAELSDVDRVRVVIEPVTSKTNVPAPTPLHELFARARPSFKNFEEVVDHIEALRSEWD